MDTRYIIDRDNLTSLWEHRGLNELKGIASMLAIETPKGTRRDGLLRQLNERMVENPMHLISAMFHYELKAHYEILTGKMTLEDALRAGWNDHLNRFLLIDIDEQPDCLTLIYPADVARAVIELAPAELKRRETDGSLDIEKFVLGFANVYGFMSMPSIAVNLPVLASSTGREIDNELLERALAPVRSMSHNDVSPTVHPLLSPYTAMFVLTSPDDYFDRSLKPKIFDVTTLMAYGEMPFPRFDDENARRLREITERFRKPDGLTTEEILTKIWVYCQAPDSLGIKLDAALFYDCQADSDKKLCQEAIAAFVDNLPMWRLRGYSLNEVRVMRLQAMSQNGPVAPLPGPRRPAKVGRNDLCPCGSGKKFKNCCGR